MKYIGFLFRDLDNNWVLGHQNTESKELEYNIVDQKNTGFLAPHELPLNEVQVFLVNEKQEDILELTGKLRLAIVDPEDETKPIDFGPLFETDEPKFHRIANQLYDIIMDRCSIEIA